MNHPCDNMFQFSTWISLIPFIDNIMDEEEHFYVS